MKQITKNLWDAHAEGDYICITTNGFVRKDGEAVMGAGVAKQAAVRFPALPRKLGINITNSGNHVYHFSSLRIITLPVKHNWWEEADPRLIITSLAELVGLVDLLKIETVAMPRPGCGNGGLKWADVYPLMKHLDDRFVVVNL